MKKATTNSRRTVDADLFSRQGARQARPDEQINRRQEIGACWRLFIFSAWSGDYSNDIYSIWPISTHLCYKSPAWPLDGVVAKGLALGESTWVSNSLGRSAGCSASRGGLRAV